ncbi:FG-GAP repeat domain-containing protein [Streptomyces sp. NPDC059618]|uniref:FG-GAP repeat domain-containing protein n=1 Tax=Streptomyces sp. NPDC059618 TaxID=3346887 RepID=UPI0036BA4B40
MGRHAPRRRGLAAAVSSVAVAVAAATLAVLPQNGASADPAPPAGSTSEITLTDPAGTQPRADRPLVAGANGFLHRQSGITGLLWTDYADGTSTVLRTPDGVYAPTGVCASLGSSTCPTAWYGSDADLVALPSAGSVALWDPATRTTSSFTSTEAYRGLAGRTVLTEYAVHDRVDGTWRSRALTPDWMRITSGAVTAADAHGVLFKVDGYLYYLDLATATATKAFSGMSARPYTVLDDDRIGWYDPASGDLHVKPRTDPGADEQVIDLPGPGAQLDGAGRWVYWTCGDGSAGVYDTKAATSRAVTGGDVLLGDGFTVRHDRAARTLVLTDAATGTDRVLATDVADTGLAMDRRFKWTVDEYTGLVAWTDLYERTHIARTGVTPSAVTLFGSETPSYVGGGMPFQGSWLLSRPVTSWSVTFASVQSGAKGKATRTVTGGASTVSVGTDWYGTTADNARFPNGWFTWVLKATGTGTSSAVTVASGEGFLQGGAPVRHDFASPDGPDGRGDLLTLNSSGGLTFQSGTGTGKFGEKVSGSGWATSVKAVPFGDLSGDRCNDVLVRLSSGALRLYKPRCGAAVTPKTSYTTLASSGWTPYDVLTSPGDVSGDGRPDLIARVASTGTVYLFKGTSTGTLSARVKLYDAWKGYKKIVGAGDLNGDGIGDLLVQDTSNTLYRYDGKGNGTFAARVKVFGDWGGAYNAVVGVGDITDDGRADLVSRDTAGNLYRNNGDGRGSFGSRTKIAGGWGGYRSLS